MQTIFIICKRYVHRLAFDVYGGGVAPPLLIFHGLFGSKNNWKEIGKTLKAILQPTRKIYAIDLRNHGQSYRSPNMTVKQLAEDIKDFIEEEGLRKVCILGYNAGGKAATHFVLENVSFLFEHFNL